MPVLLIPNPTMGIVTFSPPIEGLEKIRIFNSLGKLVQVLSGNSPQIDLSNQPTGLYFLEISHDGRVEQGKVVKQ